MRTVRKRLIRSGVDKRVDKVDKLQKENVLTHCIYWGKVAGVTGLEPAASGVTGRRSNQLSYTPMRNARERPMYCTLLHVSSNGERKLCN